MEKYTKRKNLLKFAILLVFILGFKNSLVAQSATKEIKYRRSSLCLILIESDNFPRKETVIQAYGNAPFPDKYNNHCLSINSFDPKIYPVTDEERQAQGVKKGFFKDFANDEISKVMNTTIDRDGPDMPIVTEKFIQDHRIANQVAAKWFNRQPDGCFDMKLVGERGTYDASEMEANIAKGSVRGTASLADAGEELISNTFVVFSKLQFISNEPTAAAIRDYAKAKAAKLPSFLQSAALTIADIAYDNAKDGYSVWTESFLYQLKWDDSTANIFYKDYWMDKNNFDPKKKEAFDKSDLFKLNYIGSANSSTLVAFVGAQTEDQAVELATVRNVEKVFAKLQKLYDVFKTKTPLYSGDPITAKIGMKEGLQGGEKFEVLEQTIDPKTGLTRYEKVGTISVDKKLIWDNRYNASDEAGASDSGTKSKTVVDRTTFKGGKKFYAGMLIRQLK